MSKKGLVERMDEGTVIGDGGFVFALEKRGYVMAGPWTPEASMEHPEAVLQLHKEFLRAGSDVMQAFTFYASDDKLSNRGNTASERLSCAGINKASCELARQAADEGDALVAGGICQTPSYLSSGSKEEVQAQFKQQLDRFVENKVDFLICEYFEHIEEMEWAIEEGCKTGLVVVATMCIGPEGDLHGVPVGECAVRMANAGAKAVGVNCHFDPMKSLDAMELVKEGLTKADVKVHMMCQPLAFHTPDAGRQGFIDLPEFPFGLEPRIMTRWEMHTFARRAYDMGIRYIGGCCGFEPYHIRAVAEELAKERGKLPKGSEKHAGWGGGLRMHTKPWVRARASKEYWSKLNPSSGRPHSASMSRPDAWGITQGDEMLSQQKSSTKDAEISNLEKLKNGH